MFSETVASSLTGAKVHQPPKKDPTSKESNQAQPGVVTIVDVQTVGVRQVTILCICHRNSTPKWQTLSVIV